MAPLVRTGGSRHTGLAAPPHRNIHCVRIMRLEGGMKQRFLIRRLKCSNCGRLHRELPDCLVPYKHYASEVISGVLDGIITPEDDDSADYPCEMTMRRWHCWLEANRLRIDGYLKSTGYRLLGLSLIHIFCNNPLLISLKDKMRFLTLPH